MNYPAISRRISVAMATYNGQQHIREQLNSVACQTLLPIELVITDDGSTDATLQIVDEFSRVAPFPVRVIRNEKRLGYPDNFLKAASLCREDLIAFCDQDDIWMGKKLSICAELFADPSVLLAIHSAQVLTRSGERGGYYPHFAKTRVLGLNTCNPFQNNPGFAMLIRRDLLRFTDNARRPRRVFTHDEWVWFLAATIGKIATAADVLALYRQHSSNVFGAPRPATTAGMVRSAKGTVSYEEWAEVELACSRILSAAAERHPNWKGQLKRSAEKLEYRSRLHDKRTKIYSNDSSFLRRAIIFSQILLLGGYLPNKAAGRLGIRAAIKDLLYGVPGLHRRHATAGS
jgi:glycosyltransferase involved in cell wall biosynthesis